ncbi:hypothetical protein ACIG0D_27360 [Streptomyces sp. NPDC052773]|uniref:hypothetical protein n=1 Tax=Streptomyces sp. NPDC052773 TaxID=3365693 RepID=UPI0037D6D032
MATAHLAALAAALESGDRAQVFAELADEALELSGRASFGQLSDFWGDLHETFWYEAKVARGAVR